MTDETEIVADDEVDLADVAMDDIGVEGKSMTDEGKVVADIGAL